MAYNPGIHHRKSIRLKGYDYSKAGLYFVTICIHDRKCLLGEIHDGEMLLNNSGKICQKYLADISVKYNQAQIHAFVVMPNHVHAIIEIKSDVGVIHESPEITNNINDNGPIHESSDNRPIHESPLQLRDQRRKMLLPKIIGWYKMNTAKQINIIRHTEGVTLWQRNYYEHIIRNEQSYQTISKYINDNPSKWSSDKFHME